MSADATRNPASAAMASKLNGQPDENTKPLQNERLLSFQQTSTTSIPSERSREDILQAAIRISLAGGAFADTEFRVFSRRTSAGAVKAPLSIYANSLVLKKASPHFVHLLSGGFSESMLSGQEFVLDLDEETSVEAYGYESDSDLEDDDDEDDDEDKARRAKEDRQREEPTSAGSSVPPASNSEGLPVSKSTPPLVPISLTASQPIFVRDMAFKTWQAFTYYAYLGKVDFTPLRSQHGGKLKTEDGWSALCETPRCSPKSMYRLADKYDMKDLRELAKAGLEKRLTESNIMPEMFSRFTSRYPEILALEIKFVQGHRDVESRVKAALPRWIEEIAEGHLTHAGKSLAALVTALTTTSLDSGLHSFGALSSSATFGVPKNANRR